MLARMTEHHKTRMDGWTVNLVNQWFPITELDKPTIIGSFAWTQSATRTKWIHTQHAVLGGGGWTTPADLSRDYLAVKYKDRRVRANTKQYEAVSLVKRQAPLAALPGQYDAVYLDLVSAYWSILEVIGWDVDYSPGRFLGVRSSVGDYPYQHVKLSKNCMVSCALPGNMRLWTGKTMLFEKKRNKFINMVMWACVMDVLNGIAHDMIHKAHAVYVHTDGYIIPMEYERVAYEVADEWGLVVREKGKGQGEVRGIGDYTVGDRSTKVHRIAKPHKFYKINPHGGEWLKRNFSRQAHKSI
jgi:hypothetical protein